MLAKLATFEGLLVRLGRGSRLDLAEKFRVQTAFRLWIGMIRKIAYMLFFLNASQVLS